MNELLEEGGKFTMPLSRDGILTGATREYTQG